jgi:hypothetical protein
VKDLSVFKVKKETKEGKTCNVYLGKLQEAGPRGTAGQGESEEGGEAADCKVTIFCLTSYK